MFKSSIVTAALAAGALAGLVWMGPSFGQAAEDEAAMARDLSVAQKPIFQFGLTQIPNRIDVEAWVDNPHLTYAIGQPVRIIVRPHQDAYITIVDVGSSGRVSVLYPNHFQRDARVRARSTVMIPSDRADLPWQVKVGGPAGIDLIQVIASQMPLTLPELNALVRTNEDSPLITLGRSADDFARDLVAQLKPPTPAGAVEQVYGVRNLLIRVVGSAAPVVPPGPAGSASSFVVLPPQPPAAFGLTIRTDRPAYRVGEVVRILVSSRNDCRLTLVTVGPSGNVSQLFPNASQRDNLLRAGQVVMVPEPNSPLQIVARAPAGVEGIIGTCREDLPGTAAALDPGASGFLSIGSIQTFGRDLIASSAPAQPQGQQGKIEQASTSYIVVE
jgi:hypothetical protein